MGLADAGKARRDSWNLGLIDCRTAIPAHSLRKRLQAADSNSELSWACFLPAKLRAKAHVAAEAMRQDVVAKPASAAETTRSSAACGSLAVSANASGWWRGRVWSLSREPEGCRKLQDELDNPTLTAADRAAFASELRGHVAEGARCPQANFVLQKCIVTCAPAEVQFIVDEIIAKGPGAAAQVARHKYGCRIIQRLLEALPEESIKRLADGLLMHAGESCLHAFGNYAMQHLLEHGTSRQRSCVVKELMDHAIEETGSSTYWAVVVKAMTYAQREDQLRLACFLRDRPNLMRGLGTFRLGRIVARLVADATRQKESGGTRGTGYSACVGGG